MSLATEPTPTTTPESVEMKTTPAPGGGAPRRTRLGKMLLRRMAKASKDFGLLEPGDRVMACVSGGKDSYAMLVLLHELRSKLPFDIDIVAVNLDQKQPGFPADVIPRFCEERGYAFHGVTKDTYSVVVDKIAEGKTYCSLCSRLRRGILYDTAQELGCTKIALGHHRDDLIETLLLNVLYSGQIKAMPPKLRSDDGRNVVIRPLAYCSEEDLEAYSAEQGFPIIPCDLCGSQENLHRKQIKRLIAELHGRNGKVKGNLFAALQNVRVSHLLDRDLWARTGHDLALASEDPTLAALGGDALADDDGPCGVGSDDADASASGFDTSAMAGMATLGSLRLGRRSPPAQGVVGDEES